MFVQKTRRQQQQKRALAEESDEETSAAASNKKRRDKSPPVWPMDPSESEESKDEVRNDCKTRQDGQLDRQID